jgi:ribonuclease T2
MNPLLIATIAAAALCAAAPAHAQIAMSGTLTAARACPAVQSIKKQTNPGDVALTPGRAYPIVGKNKDEATHFLVIVDGAAPAQRWVETGCGRTDAADAAPKSGRATHVLALSWEPQFCSERPEKAECGRQTAKSYDATHLSLHGLWPQPRGVAYCGAPSDLVAADKRHDWASLPEPDLSPPTRERLAAQMPGLASGLQRHEWIVHGVCYGASADAYFDRAAGLARQVNESQVAAVFAAASGRALGADAIRAAFDAAFGQGAGARVLVSCRGKGADRKISEIVLSLAGDVKGSAPLGELLRAAPPTDPGCPSGLLVQPAR